MVARIGEPLRIGEIASDITEKASDITLRVPSKLEIVKARFGGIDKVKQCLWDRFLFHFKKNQKQEFEKNPDALSNLSALFFYFLEDEKFFSHENVYGSISKPNFNKGILLVGGYGNGKTTFMRAMKDALRDLGLNSFSLKSTNSIVQDFEKCSTPYDKEEFYNDIKRGSILLDDIGAERHASNYGKVELIKEVLEERNINGKLTHGTCNFAEDFDGDVKEALLNIGERYGGRVNDRIYGMFNVVEFKGKSMRR